MRGVTPDGGFNLVILTEIFSPKTFAGFGVQATQVTHGAEGIDAPLMNQRRGSRPAGVGDLVGAIIFILPDQPAVTGIETQNSLFAEDALACRPQWLPGFIASSLAIHNIKSAVSY